MSLPIVLLPADRLTYNHRLWYMTPTSYADAALAVARAIPVVLPALGNEIDFDSVLDRVDGVLLTGALSNVHPSLYGEEPTVNHEPYDMARDATTLPLARRAIERGIPLLGICRGYQEMNVALGGSLHTEIQTFEGRMDHRAPVSTDQNERYRITHPIHVIRDSCIGRIFDADSVDVNSLHRQAIATLSPRLAIEATAPDGTIEAVRVADAKGFAIGVQWHPEYWAQTDGPSRKIFEAFGDAMRGYAAAKAGPNL